MLYWSFFTLTVISGHLALKVAFKACFKRDDRFYFPLLRAEDGLRELLALQTCWFFLPPSSFFLVVFEAAEVPGPGPAAGPLLAGSSTCRWTSSSQTCGIKDPPQLYQAADSRQQ